jgi:hypothetical protein
MILLDRFAFAPVLFQSLGNPFFQILDAVGADAELYEVKSHIGNVMLMPARVNAPADFSTGPMVTPSTFNDVDS